MDASRVVAILAFLTLAGCASPRNAPTAAHADSQQDLQVLAIRVEPFTNAVDWNGQLQPKACDPVDAAPCRYPIAGINDATNPVGFDVRPQDNVFQESRGLFWRIGVNATWKSDGPLARPVTMSVAVLRGDGSVTREIGNKTDAAFVEFPLRDVFLQPGETGIRLRVDLGDQYPFAIGNGVEFHVQGVVQAFLPAAAPMALT